MWKSFELKLLTTDLILGTWSKIPKLYEVRIKYPSLIFSLHESNKMYI